MKAGLREACGVCGGMAPGQPLAHLVCFALYALQHRGQESAGIAVGSGEGGPIWLKKGLGLVSEVFPHAAGLKRQRGPLALGHVRYDYGGEGRNPENTQPLLLRYRHGELALAHNGRLVNEAALRDRLAREGAIFQTGTDSELLGHLIARQNNPSLEESLAAVAPQLQGAFAFILSDGKKLAGLRDRQGLRPLSLGRLGREGYFMASETCAFDTIGARFVREVEPGEAVVLDERGLRSFQALPAAKPSHCLFEYIYFARPDSSLQGKNVHLVRRELGRRLAVEHPADADIVTGVPDSSIAAASGYAEQAGLPYEMALVKNRYIGRTFLRPTQQMREEGVDLKLNAVEKIVQGKKVVIVDDSMVRGTTGVKLVHLMRRAGARAVHLRISSPPVIDACLYGIDMPAPVELIAYERGARAIAGVVGADSLGYLSLEATVGAVGLPPEHFCLACFNGSYPVR